MLPTEIKHCILSFLQEDYKYMASENKLVQITRLQQFLQSKPKFKIPCSFSSELFSFNTLRIMASMAGMDGLVYSN